MLGNNIAHWIRNKIDLAGCDGAVFGLSGGIDSAVVGALSKMATNNCVGLAMPCGSNPRDYEDAVLVSNKFSIKLITVSLDEMYDLFKKHLPASKNKAEANLKARLRMCTLYYYANTLNYLVIGSGNRSELTVGYFTKYGDGGVDILPIGNLVKKEVVELAKSLGVPERIINKPPSAGLWDGQTDENEMGLTYNDLDNYIKGNPVNSEVAFKIEMMRAKAIHKLKMPEIFR